MASLLEIEFNNGIKCPKLVFGTFMLPDNEQSSNTVYEAIRIGYRHIDTAWIYRNEAAVGNGIRRAIAEGIVNRSQIFVTTKLFMHDFDKVEQALQNQLTLLGLDYVDLYLVHWGFSVDEEKSDAHDLCINLNKKVYMIPGKVSLQDMWKQMEAVCEKGLAKSIGVSNYTTPLLWDMQTYAKIKPVCNQMESHPYNQQNEVREVGLRFGTIWEAYTVIGNWQFMKNMGIQYLLDDEEIKKIAAKHSKTPAQVCIAWALSRGIAIVKASSSERMQENFDAQAFTLSEEDMQTLNSLDKNISYRVFGSNLFGFSYYS